MPIEKIFDEIEEAILDILARIDDGDEEALKELKKAKRYFSELSELMSVINDDDTVETIKKKLDELSNKFDEFLMSIVKVVG